VDANEDRHSRHEPERQPSFEFGFSGSDEPFSSPLLHYGVWDNFSPQKNNTQKNTPQSIQEYENKKFARKRLPFRKRLRVLSGGRFSAGESGLVENSQLALVT
jgi:hypothetical protein